MENIFEKLTVFNKETKNFFVFSHINLMFGYAGAGKTSVISLLTSIFSGKDKKHQVNGTQTMPNDFNLLSVSNEEGVFPHLKLNSKSLIRKTIESGSYSEEMAASFASVQKGFSQAQAEIESLVRSILPNAKIEVTNLEKPMSLLLDNLSITLENDSSSESKWQLFSVITRLAEETQNRTLVFLDDFNNDFDEEYTIKFFEKMNKSKATFFLTTSKPIPQNLLGDSCSVFGIRNGKLIQIPSLPDIADEALTKDKSYQTYEEYMMDAWYIDKGEIKNLFVEQIKNDIHSNLLRLLTSKDPIIGPKPVEGKVTIVPRSKEEESFYKLVLDQINSA